MTTHTIVRKSPKSLASVAGIAVPAFIRNGTYYFTELDVYADGIVECWGAVDLDFLEKKIESGWIAPTIPNGADIGIHDVIQGKVVSGRWTQDSRALHERLLTDLRHLNPTMDGLIDFEGEDVEVRNGVRYSKVGLTTGAPKRRTQDRQADQDSKSRFAFVHESGQAYLTAIRIYADGGIDVHPLYGEERVIDFESFKKMVKANEISVTVSDGTLIEIDTFGRFEVAGVWSYVKRRANFVKEIKEMIGELRGEPDSLAKCREAYQEYIDNPSVQNRELLKQAYEAVPEHHRMYVGDMDTKDIPVRMIIYGDDQIEGWSHRAVARSLGDEELPTIRVPKPIDEDEKE